MNDLQLLRDAGPGAAPLSPSARSAARAALLTEIEGAAMRAAPRRKVRIGRTAALRTGVAAATAAAAWAGAVAITGPEAADPAPGGMTLVAVDEITFPLSLDPVPAGMTPSFTGSTGDPEAVAGYTSPDGTGFAIYLSPTELPPADDPNVTDRGTVAVAGAEARWTSGVTPEICTVANVCFEDLPFAELIWERAPGQWIRLSGDGSHGDVAALVAVGESLVDRPQPITLQVGLAPAGWSVVDWHESSGAIGVASDEDPTRAFTVQCMPEAPAGANEMDNGTVEGRVASVTALDPPVTTTVGGQPARMVRAADYMDADQRFWLVAWELPDGTLCSVQTPEDFTRDDVLAIAEGVAYTP
ncbi:hypothetical protein SAMN05660662_4002 [Blastococcus aurantiacus]|uniref:Uncharacterized protein n=1 Tax=Blastococcus aurantiacus TaxID=1550231 RepID=A0A1G7QGN3_9ACTN|nr:hypothetical protein [Blastococcus aurantiacus]SDF97703.1 hypothetical protein SAMN05660662_4002 [Blastococcus aurantiacus]